MATCTHCSKRIKHRNSVGIYWCRSCGPIRRAEAAWLEAMIEFGWPESYYRPDSAFARWNMPDYICEFTDGSCSAIENVHWWGKGEAVGIATRGDGKKRVVFFKDHADTGGPWMIPRCHDRWVHNIRTRERIKVRHSYVDPSASA